MILQDKHINPAKFVQKAENIQTILQDVDTLKFICYNTLNKSNQGGQDYEKQRFTVIAA